MKHSIIIYGTDTCALCAVAKKYLKEKGFEYEYKNVGEDDKAREDMLKKNGGMLSTPTIDIDGTTMVGFDKPKMNELLEIKD